MKKIILLAFLLGMFVSSKAQTFRWAKIEGHYAYDYGYGITTTSGGDVLVAGKFEENAEFSGTTLTCRGNHDVYVAKYLKDGSLSWIKTAGGPLGDYAHALSSDGTNNVYIAGEIEGTSTIMFDGGATLTGHGDNDGFVAKYDMNGNIAWAVVMGGGGNDKCLGVSQDAAGNVYVCGIFSGTAYFGSLSATSNGDKDAFIAKLDASGNVLWVKTGGGPGRDEALGIKADASGNVYVTGMVHDAAVFEGNNISSPGNFFEMYLISYDTNGSMRWLKTGGGNYDDVGWAVTLDNANNVFVTGEFNADAYFSGTKIYTNGNADVFVASYDNSGNLRWVTKAGGTLIDRARGIGTDGTNIYITGQFGSTASFGSFATTAVDSSDIFVASLYNNGSFRWAISVGGIPDSVETLGYESGDAVCADASGNVYATGAVLDGGIFGTTVLKGFKRTDMFLTAIDQGTVSVAQVKAGSNNIWPNHTNGLLRFRLENQAANTHVELYNVLGQKVQEKEYQHVNSFEWNIGNNNKGVYFVKVITDQGESFNKVVLE